MSFSRPIQWYLSHLDPIWPNVTINKTIYEEDRGSGCCGVLVCKTRADYAEEEETNIQN
jgi:hypothetical protein